MTAKSTPKKELPNLGQFRNELEDALWNVGTSNGSKRGRPSNSCLEEQAKKRRGPAHPLPSEEETELPEWVSIYFLGTTENEYRCNICQMTINTDKKSMQLLEHIKSNHKEVHDLHKENPEATVGFRIEFLHLNMLKDDGDAKTEPVIIGEVCEEATEVCEGAAEVCEEIPNTMTDEKETQLVVMPPLKKKPPKRDSESRKKSWVWKYFTSLSSIIYRCNICEVVLSIKGCNTNNMNRHVRSKHPSVYHAEMYEKQQGDHDFGMEIVAKVEKDQQLTLIEENEENLDISQASAPTPTRGSLHRRSWIWLYFERLTSTLAQCKLCHRNICHGGNATGNMNRHLKLKHNKTSGDDHNWIWKVFDNSEADFFACKICQYRCMKFNDIEKSITCIRHHLKLAHGVVSGEQIITSIECGEDED